MRWVGWPRDGLRAEDIRTASWAWAVEALDAASPRLTHLDREYWGGMPRCGEEARGRVFPPHGVTDYVEYCEKSGADRAAKRAVPDDGVARQSWESERLEEVL